MKTLLALVLLAMPCLADEIVLKDGRRIAWKSVVDDGDAYSVETKDGKKLTLKKTEVERFANGGQDESGRPVPAPLTGATFALDIKRCTTIDLLPRAKTETTSGMWKTSGKTVMASAEGRATLNFDHEIADEYDLVLQVERVGGNGGLEVGVVSPDGTGAFHFDAYGATSSFFGQIGGQFCAKQDGQMFKPGKPRTVKVSVRKDAVQVQIDGKDLWKNRVDWKTVSLFGDVPRPEARHPFICGQGGWKVTACTITQLK